MLTALFALFLGQRIQSYRQQAIPSRRYICSHPHFRPTGALLT